METKGDLYLRYSLEKADKAKARKFDKTHQFPSSNAAIKICVPRRFMLIVIYYYLLNLCYF